MLLCTGVDYSSVSGRDLVYVKVWLRLGPDQIQVYCASLGQTSLSAIFDVNLPVRTRLYCTVQVWARLHCQRSPMCIYYASASVNMGSVTFDTLRGI